MFLPPPPQLNLRKLATTNHLEKKILTEQEVIGQLKKEEDLSK